MQLRSSGFYSRNRPPFPKTDKHAVSIHEICDDLRDVSNLFDIVAQQIANVGGTPNPTNYSATTNPTTNDNLSLGYLPGSIWYNTVSQTFWFCVSSTGSTALWSSGIVGTPGALSNMNATTNPGLGDDSGDGYAVGSGWLNTLTNVLWLCQDASVGAADWFALPNGTATTVYANRSLFVDTVNGVNATAAVGQMQKPYQTLAAAMTAAVSGDTIFIWPTVMTLPSVQTLKNGVHLTFMGSGNIDVAGAANVAVFNDGGGTGVHCKINMGGWDFSVTNKNLIRVTGASEIDLYIREIETASSCAVFVNNAAALVNITTAMWCSTTAFSLCQMDAGKLNINVGLAENPGGKGFWAQNGGSINGNADEINTKNSCVLADSAFGTDEFNWNIKRMTSTVDWPFWISGDASTRGRLFFEYIGCASDCGIVATGTGCTIDAVGGELHMTRDTTALPIEGAIHGEAGGIVYFTGRITRGSLAINGYDLKTSGSGKIYLKNASYDVTKSEADVYVFNGTNYVPGIINSQNVDDSNNTVVNSRLVNTTINWGTFTNCTVQDADEDGHVFTFTANGQTLTSRKIKSLAIEVDLSLLLITGIEAVTSVVANNLGNGSESVSFKKTSTGEYTMTLGADPGALVGSYFANTGYIAIGSGNQYWWSLKTLNLGGGSYQIISNQSVLDLMGTPGFPAVLDQGQQDFPWTSLPHDNPSIFRFDFVG